MPGQKSIHRALISVYYKDGLESLARQLHTNGVEIYSTGGTRSFLEELGLPVVAVEDLTSYPSILGGRVKTLHPKVFGGILGRRNDESDIAQLEEFEIPGFDLVMVDLYPFEETLASGAEHADIIEKIDIGGVSLIRAAAKNFNDVLIISSKDQYPALAEILKQGATKLEERRHFAALAFQITSQYDTAISNWFSDNCKTLRYGENPHQKAHFQGDLGKVFTQLHGKELSYNNLLDIDAAIQLIQDFPSDGCAVIKHNNACGAALDSNQLEAWNKALAGDPVSAFGGIFVFNTKLEANTAAECDKLFFEVILAPGFSDEALAILKSKKNRIILKTHSYPKPKSLVRSVLNGILVQEPDTLVDNRNGFKTVTNKQPENSQLADMEFASILVKHTKSNAIVLVKGAQLLASGTGQTSRIDAMHQAVDKAKRMGFTPEGAVLASDAFFPFADSIELCAEAGISAIIQPGGSVRDAEVISAANNLNLAMVLTGTRHFKH
jgi:phosphoribosylaminoimidazolecarboxamide formyltransferase / IMP cyclohydrolase